MFILVIWTVILTAMGLRLKRKPKSKREVKQELLDGNEPERGTFKRMRGSSYISKEEDTFPVDPQYERVF